MGRVKAGDIVTLVGVPPHLRDRGELQTHRLFVKCLGKKFRIVRIEHVEGLAHPLARLDVGHVLGEESWKHTIWVEPEYLQIET
jgi:hypothetical protein